VGVFILVLMMLLTATDVSMRYFLNRPILGSYEVSEFMMAVLAACIIAHAARLKVHVNVDLLLNILPGRVQNVIGVFTNFICFVFFGLLCWRIILQSEVLHEAGSVSATISIPDFPFVLILGIGFGITSIVYLVNFFESITKAFNPWTR
jgi:TRAP-type C4-dicarboxylate transport system permease small subunit